MSWPWFQPKDAMRGFLSFMLLAAFMVALFWIVQHQVPESNKQLVTYMLGQLSAFASMPLIFYFGTSKSSSDKNELLKQHDRPLDLRGAELPDDPEKR